MTSVSNDAIFPAMTTLVIGAVRIHMPFRNHDIFFMVRNWPI